MGPVSPLPWQERTPKWTTSTCASSLAPSVTSIPPVPTKTIFDGWKITRVADRVKYSLTFPLRLIIVDYEFPD